MTGRGNFFAVDRLAWASVCGLGSINAAVAYLVLARGTLADMRSTSWSVNAIETYTGIARPRAAAAIQALTAAKFIEQTKAGKRPAYRIALPEAPAWVWLPNSIVDGVTDESAPIERIRQAQNLSALRLFVDLYAAQDLEADGGVNWQQLRLNYSRRLIAQAGAYTVWGFWSGNMRTWEQVAFVRPFLTGKRDTVTVEGKTGTIDAGLAAFWDALSILRNTKLFSFVAHLIEADTEEASVIHPLAHGTGEEVERELAHSAFEAAEAMIPEGYVARAQSEGVDLMVPVLSHLTAVQVVGLPRLLHRAHTSATARWVERTDEWRRKAAEFQEMAGNPNRRNHMQYQRRSRGIN
ncbi:hypothetical protein ASF60_22795 [Methylobacterium sp. Leaf113]|uniref:hypothetical protein n=1 Tax=Methylobacterium sp. Leaf113 TaxID=1736259 RepID=UPI0006F49EBB|nr:hypothetical protein [Methylobacterium sp. Leaf113]KQP79443.1 hypothetical protein ASF60_22795 [Methylobacterium sp. Leaf113]